MRAAVAPPVQRKLAAAAGGPVTPTADPGAATAEAEAQYGRALADWLDVMAGTEFGGLVCDYDGTVCSAAQAAHARSPGTVPRRSKRPLAAPGNWGSPLKRSVP